MRQGAFRPRLAVLPILSLAFISLAFALSSCSDGTPTRGSGGVPLAVRILFPEDGLPLSGRSPAGAIEIDKIRASAYEMSSGGRTLRARDEDDDLAGDPRFELRLAVPPADSYLVVVEALGRRDESETGLIFAGEGLALEVGSGSEDTVSVFMRGTVPTRVEASWVSDSEYRLVWSAVESALAYWVKARTDSAVVRVDSFMVLPPDTSFTVAVPAGGSGGGFPDRISGLGSGSSLTTGKTFRVRADLAQGLQGAYSESRTVEIHIPPGPIADLSVGSVGETDLGLLWTAPGDDGDVGTATAYDVRYSTTPLDEESWDLAASATGVPAPSAAGTPESFLLTGLTRELTYHVGVRTSDEGGNGSAISNVVTATTVDLTPPAPSAIEAKTVADTYVDIRWIAPGDDGSQGTAAVYDVRFRTAPIDGSTWDEAVQARGEPAPAPAGEAETFRLTGLEQETDYYVALQTSDNVPNQSGLSNVLMVTTVDLTPPAAVGDLAAGRITETSAEVSWTSPGDDGSKGTAASYDLRYHTVPIDLGNWDDATPAAGVGAPLPAGSAESFLITGLALGETYFVALRAADEVPNRSGLSNVLLVTTLDTVPPADVADLAVDGEVRETSIPLSWTAPGDDGAVGRATSYDIRYDTKPLSEETWDGAVSVLNEDPPGLPGIVQFFTVTGLAGETTYYVALKTADEAPNWSGLSNVVEVTTPDETAPAPALISVEGDMTETSVPLSWTASGDNGAKGRADRYDLRYDTEAITEGSFEDATPVAGLGTPLESGETELFTIEGLLRETTYHIALKIGDEVPNWSDISNVLTVTTPDLTPPGAVSDLAASPLSESEVALTWTAPDEDGLRGLRSGGGQATAYDVRYSSSPITEETWEDAAKVPGIDPPGPPGIGEDAVVSGLSRQTLYYFALKTSDETPNWSSLSNTAAATTPDLTPPADIDDLEEVFVDATEIAVAWTAPGDDGILGTAAEYDIRYSLEMITEETWPGDTQVAGEPSPVPGGQGQDFAVTGLEPETTYFIAMKTMDDAGNGSGLSNVLMSTTVPDVDRIPPDPVGDLRVGTGEGDVTDTKVKLLWTATGDDGDIGTAVAYDLRYDTQPILTEEDWDSASQATAEPDPLESGTPQAHTVINLLTETTYYFILRVRDENNLSDFSNQAMATTLDLTAPGAVKDLAVGKVGETTAELSWIAPADDGYTGSPAASYDLRRHSVPITPGNWDAATPVPGVSSPQAPGELESHVVTGLVREQTYYFAVRTRDNAFNESALSNVVSATTPDQTPPNAITDLRIGGITDTSIGLIWTAPDEDGGGGLAAGGGNAAQYDIRYSLEPIDSEGDFSDASQIAGEPAPAAPGTEQTDTVTGLEGGTTYFFSIKSRDNAGNWSGLSNSPDGTIPPTCPDCEHVQNDDGTVENGYVWNVNGAAPPDYGAWAEMYYGTCVQSVELGFTQTGGQGDLTMDVFVWDAIEGEEGYIPGNAICMVTDRKPSPIAFWPAVSTHVVNVNCGDAPYLHFVGFRGNWDGAMGGWFIAADENGSGFGLPRTKVAPGLGYPTGWQHPDKVPAFAGCRDLIIRQCGYSGDAPN